MQERHAGEHNIDALILSSDTVERFKWPRKGAEIKEDTYLDLINTDKPTIDNSRDKVSHSLLIGQSVHVAML